MTEAKPNPQPEYEDGVIDGEIRKYLCRVCHVTTRHTVLHSVRHRWFLGEPSNYDIAGIDDYLVVACNGCESIQFCKVSSSSDDVEPEFDPDGEVVGVTYPERVEQYPVFNDVYEKPVLYFSMPAEIRAIYNEAYGALISNLPRVAAVATRMVIEAICNINNINSGTLESKVDKLQTKNIITPSMKSLLHNVRIFGNNNAHRLEETNMADLTAAWGSINILMKNIYGTEDNNKFFEATKDKKIPF